MNSQTTAKTLGEKFLSSNTVISDIKKKSNLFWTKKRESEALDLFHQAAERVPAYKNFLRVNNVDHKQIKTFADFQNVPVINKDNYLRKYSLAELMWDGKLSKNQVFTSTSGSTGLPQYFSRSDKVDWQSSVIHELFLKNISENVKGPTLVVIGFGMGVWIGGLITYQAFEIVGKRGYPVSIITPGINKEEIFKILKNLAPNYEQTLLIGYPPFTKDIIDEAPSRGINVKKLNIKFLFAAEAFTEKFRDHLLKAVGQKDMLSSNMNIYGSADIGSMAFETPLSILIRRIAVKKPKVFESLFNGVKKTPTLAQYIPGFITFESLDGQLVLTANSSMPLIRYAIGDHGGVYSFNEMAEKLAIHKIYLKKEAEKAGISNKLYQLPFVYVFERIDFSTTLYGLQIYPETIREVLLDKPFNQFLTGKITLETKFNENQDQYLEVNLELQRGKEANKLLKEQLLSSIVRNLREKNSEFRELAKYLDARAIPQLVFWPFEDPEHFRPGMKQKWVK